MSPPQRLLLVDSHSLIYRAFFALPALTDRKGRLTNAAFGFTSTRSSAYRNMARDGRASSCWRRRKPSGAVSKQSDCSTGGASTR